MSKSATGDLVAGLSGYVPQIGGTGRSESRTVRLLRRLRDGIHVAVWSVELDSRKAAAALHTWMQARPAEWSFWGRLAFRLGPSAASALILEAAKADEDRRIERERARRAEEKEHARLARKIELFHFDPKGGRPALGLERGNASNPFFRMRFGEKWERDRVSDWLAYQVGSFAEMAEIFEEHGQNALEQHILNGMRAAEREAKAAGLACGGRRPLRFWRGG